ncbi:hypothetical protein Y032_0006g2863 [Ancylostoma ceylanicum]|nr:hypothetical protein Y032_0006g2863 [Ancylostoma ceylanicum]
MLTGRHQPRIAHRKPPPPFKKDLDFVLPCPAPKRPSWRPSFPKKRVPGPCFSVRPPCFEKNTTTRRYKGPKSILARPTTNQMSVYKRRPPLPSLPRLQRPCMDHHDAVKCWKSVGQRLEQKPKRRSHQTHVDWFTRRGQIRAENRRN